MSAPAPLLDALVTPESARQLLARVAHDLRGPLTVIMGTAQLLPPHADAEGVATILNASRKMLATLDDLSALAGAAVSGKTTRFDPPPVAIYTTGLVPLLAQAAGRSVEVDSAHPESGGTGWPVVMGLDLEATLSAVRRAAARLEAHLDAAAPLVLAWSDAGLTLRWPLAATVARSSSGDTRPAQWWPLLSLGPELGLLQPWPGAERCQGLLQVLPAQAQTEQALQSVDLTVPGPFLSEPFARPGQRVWLAEDHAEVRQLLERLLGTWGLVVDSLPDGQALISRLHESDTPPPDLVLTDMTMPGAGGQSVLHAVRARWPQVPVVLLSGTQAPPPGGGLPPGGPAFDAHLSKPVDRARLRHTLQDLLRQPPADTTAVAATDAEHIRMLQTLLAMGAVTDVLELAEHVSAQPGIDQGWWRVVRTLAQQGALDALEVHLRARVIG